MGRANTMRVQAVFLLVVSATVAAKDAIDEKIKKKHSVESFLSQLSFNPFTPFPELLTTTPSTSLEPKSPRPSSLQVSRSTERKKKVNKKKKFPVFVAVERTTTRRTILPTFVDSERLSPKVDDVKSVVTGKELSKNSVTNSRSELSDKEWIASILRRTNTRGPTTRRTTTRRPTT